MKKAAVLSALVVLSLGMVASAATARPTTRQVVTRSQRGPVVNHRNLRNHQDQDHHNNLRNHQDQDHHNNLRNHQDQDHHVR
jgi:hypothetical protein